MGQLWLESPETMCSKFIVNTCRPSRKGLFPGAIILFSLLILSPVVGFCHPEEAESECHYHLDLDEQHCGVNSSPEELADLPEVVAADDVEIEKHAEQQENQETLDSFQHLEEQSAMTASIQGGLSRLGYDVGPVTGAMNRRTQQAIKRFQSDNLLPTSGQISRSLLVIINDELDNRFGRREK